MSNEIYGIKREIKIELQDQIVDRFNKIFWRQLYNGFYWQTSEAIHEQFNIKLYQQMKEEFENG
jgi:hypothetical protein